MSTLCHPVAAGIIVSPTTLNEPIIHRSTSNPRSQKKENPIQGKKQGDPLLLKLVTVFRENNPKRTHARVWSWLGKLEPLSTLPLESWGLYLSKFFSELRGKKVLLVGVAESALIPAWIISKRVDYVTVCYSTREPNSDLPILHFVEPHSHAPDQSIVLPNHGPFDHIIVVEDEITTGNCLNNMLQTMAHLTKNFTILAMCDPNDRAHFIQSSNPELSVRVLTPEKHWSNQVLYHQVTRLNVSHAVFAIGECVQDGLRVLLENPTTTIFRHITRSPWKVDSTIIYSRFPLGNDSHGCAYFFYNPGDECFASVATIYCWQSTRSVACVLSSWLKSTNPSIKIHIKEISNRTNYD